MPKDGGFMCSYSKLADRAKIMSQREDFNLFIIAEDLRWAKERKEGRGGERKAGRKSTHLLGTDFSLTMHSL
jgi:hypothetical protein